MMLRPLSGLAAALAVALVAVPATAQFQPPPQGQPPPQQPPPQGYGQPPPQQYGQPGQYGGQVGGQIGPGQYGGQYGGYGAPYGGYGPPPSPTKKKSTALEVGYLYVTAGAYGVGTGIFLDAIFEIEDPGLRFILPGVFGVAAPVGVYVLDQHVYRPAMPQGLPSAIATGILVGAGEGLGVASTIHVNVDEENEWSFKGLAAAEFIGATAGGAGGYALYYFLRPHPKNNVFIGSSIAWGSIIGSFFGGGASNGEWEVTDDTVSVGGLVGFNVALTGAVLLSAVWTPSWDQIGWMWGGLALGTLVSLPVYIFYAGSDHDPRRGLIFQGVAATLGLGAGALIGRPDKKGAMAENEDNDKPPFAQLTGGGLMPVRGGMGVQMHGALW
jgi:hypothetical protein